MKFFFKLLFAILAITSCQESKNSEQEYYYVEEYKKDSIESKTNSNSVTSKAGFNRYTNNKYNFSLEYPKDWNFQETAIADSLQVVNFYKVEDTYNHSFPILMETNAQLTHVSFYPRGLDMSPPVGLSRKMKALEEDLPIFFSINEEQTIVYLLEGLQAFAYIFKPSSPPPGWNKDGFIYAQIAVDGFFFTCIDLETGMEKTMEDCDPTSGDKIRKYGNLNPSSRRAVMEIISSINFFEAGTDPAPITELIKVETPQPYEKVTAPLTVSGEAIKSWYNNNQFPIILADLEFQVLARSNAKALNSETKGTFIPFEISIDYKSPLHERGYLILRKPNPTRKPEQDRAIIVPVSFSPTF